MHFMSQPRYNPRTQRDDWYYRIKESFRDLTGRIRSRIMLNVGFIDEPHRLLTLRTEVHAHHGRVFYSKQQPIRPTQVKHEEDGDYYLEIPPAKQLMETSMNRKFKERL